MEIKMSLLSVYEKIAIIKATNATNDKIQLLSKYLLNDDFSTIIKLTYDSSKNYKIKSLPKRIPPKKTDLFSSGDSQTTNQDIFDFLNKLANQRGVSNQDKTELTKLASIDKETYEVVQMTVRKDCKAGFSEKLINKAKPNFIEITPYMRCSTAKNKMHTVIWNDGVFVQEKADGMFINIILTDEQIFLKSRNGNYILQLEHITDWFKKHAIHYYQWHVFMGELLIKQNGKILPRKIGNGILNSCIQGTADEKITKQAVVKLWDVVIYDDFQKGECKIPYHKRLFKLKQFLELDPDKKLLSLIPTKKVFSEDEAKKAYQQIRKKGGEGLIVKKKEALWKNHTSPDMIKMKNSEEAEMRIVGWSYGEKDTKYEKLLGSLQVETDDGKVKVSISGFTDEQREWDWNKYIGNIVSVEFESLITDKKRKDVYSLYLPRFKELRLDRSDTDSLKDLLTR
jgi:DNA ligase 1